MAKEAIDTPLQDAKATEAKRRSNMAKFESPLHQAMATEANQPPEAFYTTDNENATTINRPDNEDSTPVRRTSTRATHRSNWLRYEKF